MSARVRTDSSPVGGKAWGFCPRSEASTRRAAMSESTVSHEADDEERLDYCPHLATHALLTATAESRNQLAEHRRSPLPHRTTCGLDDTDLER